MTSSTLIMLWSSFGVGGYTVGVARSASGGILGTWRQSTEPLYAGDGGHCMVFCTFDGHFDSQLWLAFHRPNQSPNERPQFAPPRENESSIEVI